MSIFTDLILDGEDIIFTDTDKKLFYDKMTEKGFDFYDIDEETRLPKKMLPVVNNDFTAVLSFNQIILDLHRNGIINIIQSVNFLLDDYFEVNDLFKFMQTNTLSLIHSELNNKQKKDKRN